jgi:hypothetical protein
VANDVSGNVRGSVVQAHVIDRVIRQVARDRWAVGLATGETDNRAKCRLELGRASSTRR